jgi:predicted O-methyltransferase YrrM
MSDLVRAGVRAVLDRLWSEGEEHDAKETDRDRKFLHITPDTGSFLHLLVRLMQARRVLEVGTSVGYSTLWLADAVAAHDGYVTTIERNAWKIERAQRHVAEVGLGDRVGFVRGDAAEILQTATGPFDFIFLDADRAAYVGYAPHLARLLRPGGLWVTDNAVSHAGEMAAFVSLTVTWPGWDRSLVPVGKGEYLLLKAKDTHATP